MYKRYGCILALLGVILTLSGCKDPADGQSVQQDQTSGFSYAQVLESEEEKILYTGGDDGDSQALLYDLNGDGVEELLLCYLYGGGWTAFEVWTTADEIPVQLCAVSDMGNVAGNGSYGMSLAAGDGGELLCFWYQNSESSPPGSTSRYCACLWEIGDSVFPYGPQRLGWTIYRTESDSELKASYGMGSGNYVLADYENMMEKWMDAPEEQLAGTNAADGLTVGELLGQLQ